MLSENGQLSVFLFVGGHNNCPSHQGIKFMIIVSMSASIVRPFPLYDFIHIICIVLFSLVPCWD